MRCTSPKTHKKESYGKSHVDLKFDEGLHVNNFLHDFVLLCVMDANLCQHMENL